MRHRCSRYDLVDLVDGRLSPIATEQVHAHVASCAQCRSAVIAYREVSARLRSVRPAEPAPDFLLRLASIPMAQQVPATQPRNVSSSGAYEVVSLADYRDARTVSPRPRSAKKGGITAISVAGLVCVATWVGVSTSEVAVSVPSIRQVSVAPMISTFSQVHRQSTQSIPFANGTYVETDYQTTPHRTFHLVP